MKFITSIFGANYISYLMAHMYSIVINHPDDEIIVLWCDLPKKDINFLKFAFPNVEFLETEIAIGGTVLQRISQKVQAWNQASKMYPNENICFIDCDTLLVRPIAHFFEDEFDVLFSWGGKWGLSSGVLLVKNNIGVQKFMDEWLKRTENIINDPRQLDKARISSGGGDQHSLKSILNTEKYDGVIEREICGNKLIFKGISSKILHEFNPSALITEKTHIVHYGGADWNNILLYGKPLNSSSRFRKELRDYFNQILNEAKRYASKNVVLKTCDNYLSKFKDMINGIKGEKIPHQMLPICSICYGLDLDVLIIASGQPMDQKTLAFMGKIVRVIIIEAKDLFREKSWKPYKNVEYLYGEAQELMPKVIEKLRGKNIAVLFNNPESKETIDIFTKLLSISESIVVGFFNIQGAELRDIIIKRFSQYFLTDNEEYTKLLEKVCLLGNNRGQTLAIVFPSFKEKPFVRICSLFHEGMSYFEQRRYKEALLTFDRVILLGSKYPSVRNHAILQKGVTYAIMGEYEKAIKEYRRLTSFELDKKLEIIIHYNLGKLYEKTDLLRNAKDELKTLLNLCQRVNPYERKKIIKAARALSLLQKL